MSTLPKHLKNVRLESRASSPKLPKSRSVETFFLHSAALFLRFVAFILFFCPLLRSVASSGDTSWVENNPSEVIVSFAAIADSAVEMVRMARAHCQQIVVSKFIEELQVSAGITGCFAFPFYIPLVEMILFLQV